MEVVDPTVRHVETGGVDAIGHPLGGAAGDRNAPQRGGLFVFLLSV